MKIEKCPFCSNKYKDKSFLCNHLENKHKEQLNGLSPAQVYFNFKYNKTGGKCIICRKSTKWNESTNRYERICDRKETNCREKYREMFKKRMMGKYGKTTLLDEPEMQKKMLDSRKISGEYTWTNKKGKTKYTGTYEKDFLEFLDVFLHFEPSDVISPAPQVFYYEFNGKKHFYMPDFYITSINTIIEIKAFDNKHYRARDIEQEKAKDKAVLKSNFNYIKIHDKEYDEFFDYLLKFKE
ncbi:endonuclease fused to N-terminal Zn finger domain [Bacillus phage AR9]|uniref:Endonuclease fused to N-terminal Zn finger domain n=2 Tax=Bacillus phage PBS1 TaxID=10683 RepID=A0A172JIE7_BPPB1|nr:endonuclease [Bacillus phage AR9]YP_009664326.1 endonuclease [Bacillus phage PBS1]QXN70155.1 putative endonuclease fused to N-terminal zinc finger domain [Bacillus phage vB_BspM_Internexus]WCS68361.1 hypothetical protein Goe21_02510 [Bacillus phage vB_BsuM-Goe21]AMS01317.1 endonuclease fused to N-terminal Zn finger domain [Bacillus phage AR9]AST99946.1 hypothetical protein PBI_PBS1_124 [Bacillus phage PBS1]BDE75538.1 hypothetical protein [Bacillus phage PBS1]